MRLSLALLAAAVLLSSTLRAAPADTTAPNIQVALLLDVSGSMDGLLEQARAQIWTLVRTLSSTTVQGRRPTLSLALYEYGKSTLRLERHFVGQLSTFTTDLDAVGEHLQATRTNGGEEYCGAAILTAVQELPWTTSKHDLRFIVIAGNEPFTQGPIAPPTACAAAVERGIVILSIHCGDAEVGRRQGWESGALCSGGTYAAIDANRTVALPPTPYDTTLLRLNERLNGTYVGYGREAAIGKRRLQQNDRAAEAMAANVLADRVAAKASAAYSNASWDAVDLYRSSPQAFAAVPADALPDSVAAMDSPARERWAKTLLDDRRSIQAAIADVQARRERFYAEQRSADDQNGLGSALVAQLRPLLASRGYMVE